MYDFDRVDAAGNKRELHVDLALDAINYAKIDTNKNYTKHINQSNSVVDCPYFTTNFLLLDGKIEINKTGNSFTVYMCVEGDCELEFEGVLSKYIKGDTVLMPAALKNFVLSGNASILEIYIS